MGIYLDEVRRLIQGKSKELETTMADMSKAISKAHSFISQFITRGIPECLPEDVRHKLAKAIGVSEELLRGRDLDAPLIEIQSRISQADFEDMWRSGTPGTPEERQLIVDLARQVLAGSGSELPRALTAA